MATKTDFELADEYIRHWINEGLLPPDAGDLDPWEHCDCEDYNPESCPICEAIAA